jgi:hypothetical protein
VNQLLEKNLIQLEKSHPKLVQALRELPSASDRIDIAQTKSGDISIRVSIEGKWQTLMSRYNPRDEAIMQVEKQWQEDAEIYFVFGIGGFYHVEEILRRTDDQVNVVVVGADRELFKTILVYRDLTSILSDPRLVLAIGADIPDVYQLYGMILRRDMFDLPKVCIIELPIENRIYSHYYEICKKCLVDVYRQGLANVATRIKFGDQWVRNILANLPDILRTSRLEDLHNCLKGKPAILVSAGPSLNKNIHLLKEIGDRALIVCVDTAYRALQNVGIVPHLLVSVDGSHLNYKHFEGVDYSNIPLVMEMSVHEEVVKHHQGPKAVLCSMSDFIPWLKEAFGDEWKTLSLPTGGSVATTAFSVIEYLGCDPLIFVGQDLSYPNGQAYATGTKFESLNVEEIRKTRNLIPLVDIYGNQVLTTNDYLIYLKWFEEKLQSGKRTYINATEGGALRNGVTIMTLREAIDRYCTNELPIPEMIKKMSNRRVAEQVIRQGYRKMRQTVAQLKRLDRDLEASIKLLYNFLDALEKEDVNRVQELLEPISSLEKRMERYKLALKFLDATAYREVFADIHTEEALSSEILDSREKDLASCRRSIAFYNLLRTVCHRSLDMLELYSKRYYERFYDMEEMKAQ